MNNPSKPGNNFNLLRLIFATMVIVSHAPELQDGNRNHEILTNIFNTISLGELAVDSFFILSGFLIVKSWDQRPSFQTFFMARILRICPGYLVASMICALIIGPIFGANNYLSSFDIPKFMASILKLSAPITPEIFIGSHYPRANASLWSIHYEFICYMLVLGLGLLGVVKNRSMWLLITVFFMAIYALSKTNAIPITNISINLFVRCSMAFMTGGCFYLFRNMIVWNRGISTLSFLILLPLMLVQSTAEIAVAIFWGYLIVFYAIAGKQLLDFRKLPDISYGVYLYAFPINKIILYYTPNINVYLSMLIVLFSSIIAGLFSWYLIERPFMALKSFNMERYFLLKEKIL